MLDYAAHTLILFLYTSVLTTYILNINRPTKMYGYTVYLIIIIVVISLKENLHYNKSQTKIII